MRFAPNPNGPATLGSARGIIINSELAKRYDGKFILRFDDTDPKTKRPLMEAYRWYIDDCKWLNAYPDEIYYASDRISIYYEYAEKLIKNCNAYICFCKRNEFREYKDNKTECPHRKTDPDMNILYWHKMLKGDYKDGECVLRIKTDMKHEDPAIRDWVAFRIIREEHPRVGRRFIVWPTLDFESAIEDHIMGVTHIIRGKDLIDSEKRQRYIYRYLNWRYPITLHWGRISIEEFGKFSTSKLKRDIENGKYSGWDDPRIPTLMSLRRRGISPNAIRNVIIALGIGENDISLSLKSIYSENRKILDSVADRYFFVANPIKLVVKNVKNKLKVKIPFHPSFHERGFRGFDIIRDETGNMKFFISMEDVNNIKKGEEIRLIGVFNIRIKDITKEEVIAEYIEKRNLDVPKIHWVQKHIDAIVIKPDGIVKGFCEPLCEKIKIDSVVQFERFGFVRLDHKYTKEKKSILVFYYAHK